jgi:Ycf66 protein N-terminus
MLAYILSIIVAVFSLILFGLAFFAPKLHRRDDFWWSGIGLFYALVLWLCAQQITGAVLLGQTAAAILLLSFGWQTLKFRDAIAHPEKGIDLSFSVIDSIENFLGSSSSPKITQPSSVIKTEEPPISETLSSVKEEVTEKASEVAAAVGETVSTFVEDNKLDEKLSDMKSEIEEVVADAKAATSADTGFSIKKFLNFRKTPSKPEPIAPKTTLNEIDDFEIAVENKVVEPPVSSIPPIREPEPMEPEIKVDRFVPSNWTIESGDTEDIEISQPSDANSEGEPETK